jgi:hypothetical protein
MQNPVFDKIVIMNATEKVGLEIAASGAGKAG